MIIDYNWDSYQDYLTHRDSFSMTPMEMLYQFHIAMGQPVDVDITRVDVAELEELRERLIDEEYKEQKEALYLQDKVKELCDLLYVIYGWGVTFGIDLEEAFRRVHLSNMSKLGEDGKPIYREDGKVMKGPNYSPPELEDLV